MQHSLKSLSEWKEEIADRIGACAKGSMALADQALQAFPTDPDLLLMASLAALIDGRPDNCLRYLNRLHKRYAPIEDGYLLRALALAQQQHWTQAWLVLKQHGLLPLTPDDLRCLPLSRRLFGWIIGWLDKIVTEHKATELAAQKSVKRAAAPVPRNRPVPVAAAPVSPPSQSQAAASAPSPVMRAEIPVQFQLPKASDIFIPAAESREEPIWFKLRADLTHLSLLQGFDELLCLPLLKNVTTYWYQVETVRKVLKQFRGRVLLADEVGLGKTIEAGMVLKEYLLRGMAERVLILTPASLVGQWLEEMASKFEIEFISSYDAMLRSDPEAFWSQPKIIASIGTARRAEHMQILARQSYDLVIVDEAHHLKNRATSNWKLVDAIQKRFLLLLSATPVQNNLIELYNLLTLLKPGIFHTEKEFRARYMTARKPRVPANREKLRDLMRDVMVRNTRALVDLRLPPRQAITQRLQASAQEAGCYQELTRLVQQTEGAGQQRLALRHLLTAAGSSPAAVAVAIDRFATTHKQAKPWHELRNRYQALTMGIKEAALLDLLRRNPAEKKMIFVHHRETLARLSQLLAIESFQFVSFEGSMSGPDKDLAIEQFREVVPLLLCTESGGEGRNLQFCNTLINFDLPWNPMAIEQRIGRLHRIGQTRQVFIFNLVVANTIEEHILHILDEKINMFELVVGEIGEILGELDEDQDFAEMVFTTWLESTEAERGQAFERLGERLVAAKRQYEEIKSLDEELFGQEFETA